MDEEIELTLEFMFYKARNLSEGDDYMTNVVISVKKYKKKLRETYRFKWP